MEEDWVSYIQSFILICRLKSTHTHNILWLIICMRKFVWLSSLSISHSDFISDDNIFQASCIAEPKFCIWSIPLTENIPLSLHLTCLAADLIITAARILYWCRLELSVLLWGVHTNAKFDYQPQDQIFPISLQSAENSILFSWVSKYLNSLLILRVRWRLMRNSL